MAPRLPGQRVRAHLARRREARRTLRRPSGFRIAIADSISQLDRDAWDDVVEGASWFFSRDYLAMLERVPPAGVEPRYALVSDDQGPVAAVVLQWAEVEARDWCWRSPPPGSRTTTTSPAWRRSTAAR